MYRVIIFAALAQAAAVCKRAVYAIPKWFFLYRVSFLISYSPNWRFCVFFRVMAHERLGGGKEKKKKQKMPGLLTIGS